MYMHAPTDLCYVFQPPSQRHKHYEHGRSLKESLHLFLGHQDPIEQHYHLVGWMDGWMDGWMGGWKGGMGGREGGREGGEGGRVCVCVCLCVFDV